MTGTWRAKLHADPKDDAITQTSFLVEDYVPERLDMTLKDWQGACSPWTRRRPSTATGRYLYGHRPPVSPSRATSSSAPRRRDVEGFPGFQFGQADETFTEPVRKPLENLPSTGEDGNADVAGHAAAAVTQDRTRRSRPTSSCRLREAGGRTIERAITLPVDLQKSRIGIKSAFTSNNLGEGEKASFDAVAARQRGQAADRRAQLAARPPR